MTNIFIKAVLPAIAFSTLLVACSDDDYKPAAVPDNAQVYFDYTQNTAYSLEENQESIQLKIYRIDTSSDLSVPVTFSQPEGQENIFILPATADFVAGESVTNLNIGIDFAKVVARQAYSLSVEIDPAQATPYGDSSCSLSVDYYEKGDPMRDAISGFYSGEASGGQYWSNPFVYTAWSQNYGVGGIDPVRAVQGDARDEIGIRNLLPDNDACEVNDIVGTVYTFGTKAEAEEWYGSSTGATWWGSDSEGTYDLLGYILLPAQACGTITLNYWGVYTYDMYFGAAWSSGSWATSPTDDLYVYILGRRHTTESITGQQAGDDTYTVKQLDFYAGGWAMLFGYAEYGAWYYGAYGGNVLDKM